MPLALVVTPGGAPEGAFSLEADQGAGAAPLTAEESRYANAISDIFRLVAQREAAAQDGSEIGKQKAAAKIKRGRILVEKLTEDAKRALSSARSSPGAVEAASNAAVVAYGRYIEACDLVDRRPFEITLQRREDAGEAQIKELKITVVDAVDESAPQTSTTTNALFTAIGVASSVFDTVLTQELERRRRWWRRSSRVAASHAAAIALHGEFVEKLSGVAEIGLRGGRPELGALALRDLREQYVRRVAPAVKNRHMASLGVWCLAAALLALAAHNLTLLAPAPFAGFSAFFGDAAFWAQKRAFFLLIAGSSVGAWASFAMRNETLSFTQLASPQADMLRPFMRVAFVTALTSLIGLILWTGFLTFSIGGVQAAAFRSNGSIALLLGALCGLSERALSTALVNQSNAFARNFEATGPDKPA